MIDIMVTLIWIGGIGPAGHRCRQAGCGRVRTAIRAFAWPYGVGSALAKTFFDPDTKEGA